ncbi:dihydroxyacetone kinase phosphoryl donor subunit DhaM [Corynebacterium sp. TAE3-ERU30]|uniref:dihydroxyacetone kinase phosphoryl donor subunit DhaM n=1 Tax=Corynebacterium sp. TAE3-ERU30 TaxID=2849496 RepID=UPI001C443B32|nr:dihydroxyacetone kinase phosphoryl donor subunit DhaM [Corynebacterium sp. TAE3-ERU30]MBV7282361.1 PTS-dependent dihydroxyacetone kinase phosphotransferase subunit DhaM [Corynebacterium sp. TAE3-ERU30]
MAVGLVFVSHSAQLAEGLRDLARQMASEVDIRAAGGTADGGIGTSYDRIESAVTQLRDADREVLILTDLGSATMTVEMLLEFHEDEPICFVDAPLVEGGIAAAVAAQQGVDLRGVMAAARNAIYGFRTPTQQDTAAPEPKATTDSTAGYSRTAVVADEVGLHARPAALIAEMAATAEGEVAINDADAASALMVMGLGIAQGETVTISGEDRDSAVIDRIAEAIAAGLD